MKIMKQPHVSVLALAVALYCAPAFAQHGHSGGSMGGMGAGMGHGASTHGSMGNGSSSSTPAMKMDQQLSKNTKLAGTIHTLTGLDAKTACDGFKNLGQCVAAAHVSKNLGITFDCMKSDMTGTAPPKGISCPAGTGAKSMSLGKSIQALSPTSDSKTESKKGTHQADQDLKDSNNS
jgi:hypothetical protein